MCLHNSRTQGRINVRYKLLTLYINFRTLVVGQLNTNLHEQSLKTLPQGGRLWSKSEGMSVVCMYRVDYWHQSFLYIDAQGVYSSFEASNNLDVTLYPSNIEHETPSDYLFYLWPLDNDIWPNSCLHHIIMR